MNICLIGKKMIIMRNADFKKAPEELAEYLMFKRRGTKVEPRKGKGSYKRRSKRRNKNYDLLY